MYHCHDIQKMLFWALVLYQSDPLKTSAFCHSLCMLLRGRRVLVIRLVKFSFSMQSFFFSIGLHHMCSSSDGFVVTMDASTGEFQNKVDICWLNVYRTVWFKIFLLLTAVSKLTFNNKTTKTIYLLTEDKVLQHWMPCK